MSWSKEPDGPDRPDPAPSKDGRSAIPAGYEDIELTALVRGCEVLEAVTGIPLPLSPMRLTFH